MDEELTKKEKRKLAKEEKRRQRERGERLTRIRKWIIRLLAIGVLLFGGYKLINWIRTPVEIPENILEIGEDDWVKGSSQASLTLIEYSDFQCPSCALYVPIMKRLASDFGDDLGIVYRHFPLVQSHRNATPAAKAAEAGGRQGKFWEMHDKLFEKQGDWENERDPKDKFVLYAEELDLDKEKFLEDYQSNQVAEKVDSDLESANLLRLNSTPSFFLNKKKIQNPQGYSAFKELIESEIRGYTLE